MTGYKIIYCKVSVGNKKIATLFWLEKGDENQIKCEGFARDSALALVGGPAVSLHGLAVARKLEIEHQLKFDTVAIFKEKLNGYVIEVAHGSTYKTGDLIPAIIVKNL